jgi:hypothetical protein
MNDVLLLILVLWGVYVSDSLWWTTERSVVLFGDAAGSFSAQYGPSLRIRQDGGYYVCRLLPPFPSAFELNLDAAGSNGATVADVRQRVLDIHAASRRLRTLGEAFWWFLLVVAPVFALTFGLLRAILPLLVVAVAGLAITVVCYRRSWRELHGAAQSVWRGDAVLMLLSPPGAVRAADRLTRNALRGFPPMRVARALASDAEFCRLSRLIYFDAATSDPLRHEIDALLDADGLRATFDAQPRREDGMKGFCPRCHELFLRDSGECPDCVDVTLRSFARQ